MQERRLRRIYRKHLQESHRQEYKKSVAQVALRFLIQSNVVVIPKSTHKERMEENFNVFDFTLSADDMKKIEALDGAIRGYQMRGKIPFDPHII